MFVKRQGLIVWFQNRRNLRQIRRYGRIIYVSRKMRFVVLYVNKDDIEDVENKLNEFRFVKKIERSYKPYIDTTFRNPKFDEAKLYDYK